MTDEVKALPRVGEWTNSLGLTFKLRGINQYARTRCERIVIQRWIEIGRDLPQVPTYTTTTDAGTKEKFSHTKESCETDEEKAQWEIYEKAKNDFDVEFRNAYGKQFMLCVDMKPLEDTEWLDEIKWIYGYIPKDKFKLMELYFEDRVIPGDDDMQSLILNAMLLGNVQKEVIDSIEKSFRGNV